MGCKHKNTMFWCYGVAIHDSQPRHDQCKTLLCRDCDELLPLGASNDAPPEVQVEIKAAELATARIARHEAFGADRFDYCPATKSDDLCDLCQAHVLAHEIAARETP